MLPDIAGGNEMAHGVDRHFYEIAGVCWSILQTTNSPTTRGIGKEISPVYRHTCIGALLNDKTCLYSSAGNLCATLSDIRLVVMILLWLPIVKFW